MEAVRRVDEGTERFSRQTDILKPDVCKKSVHIIGCGATGSFLALALAKMGLSDITVYDGDSVEEHNFPNQLFPLMMKGKNKAEGTHELVKYFTGTVIKFHPVMYKKQELNGIVISALDSMKGRKLIYNNCKDNEEVELIIDPRTGGELFKLLTVDMSLTGEKKKYEESFFSDEEAAEIPCTARSIIYSVLGVSAFISKQVKHFLMNEPFKRDIIIDLKYDMTYFEG